MIPVASLSNIPIYVSAELADGVIYFLSMISEKGIDIEKQFDWIKIKDEETPKE